MRPLTTPRARRKPHTPRNPSLTRPALTPGFALRRVLTAAGAFTLGLALLSGCAAAAPEAQPSTPAPANGAEPTAPATTTPLAPPTEAERQRATVALVAAVSAGDLAAASAAVTAGAHLNERGELGRTPLVAATKAQQTEIALLLLEAGADPNVQDDLQDSAFLYAGAEGLNEILQATLRYGADVHSTNRFGGTALIPASEHGYVSTVELLIAAGVPLDHINSLGWSALHEAIVLNDGGSNQVAVVEALLAAGANPTLPDGHGTAPRDLAAQLGYWNVVRVIDAYL